MAMNVIPLSEFGLVTVAEVVRRKKWGAKTVQRWVGEGLIPVVVVGTGRSAKFLLRATDVDAFTPPPRGRPPKEPEPKPVAEELAKKKPKDKAQAKK